jgi:hypothetical protein
MGREIHLIVIEAEFEQDQYNLSDALLGTASSSRSSEPALVSWGMIGWHGQGAILPVRAEPEPGRRNLE